MKEIKNKTGTELIMTKKETKSMVSFIRNHYGDVQFESDYKSMIKCTIKMSTPDMMCVFVGVSKVHPDDEYNKWFGRCVAFSRAWRKATTTHRMLEYWFQHYIATVDNWHALKVPRMS